MAKIHKLIKDGNTIYPATTTDAVVHPLTQSTVTEMTNEYNVSVIWPTGGADAGNKYTLETAIAKLDSALTSAEKIKGVVIKFYDGNNNLQEYTYISGNFGEADSWIPTGHNVVNELNISFLYPTSGQEGDNKYTLETAIALVPDEYRVQGLKVSFININNEIETWGWIGNEWSIENFFEVGIKKIIELNNISTVNKKYSIPISNINENQNFYNWTYGLLFNGDTYSEVTGAITSEKILVGKESIVQNNSQSNNYKNVRIYYSQDDLFYSLVASGENCSFKCMDSGFVILTSSGYNETDVKKKLNISILGGDRYGYSLLPFNIQNESIKKKTNQKNLYIDNTIKYGNLPIAIDSLIEGYQYLGYVLNTDKIPTLGKYFFIVGQSSSQIYTYDNNTKLTISSTSYKPRLVLINNGIHQIIEIINILEYIDKFDCDNVYLNGTFVYSYSLVETKKNIIGNYDAKLLSAQSINTSYSLYDIKIKKISNINLYDTKLNMEGSNIKLNNINLTYTYSSNRYLETNKIKGDNIEIIKLKTNFLKDSFFVCRTFIKFEVGKSIVFKHCNISKIIPFNTHFEFLPTGNIEFADISENIFHPYYPSSLEEKQNFEEKYGTNPYCNGFSFLKQWKYIWNNLKFQNNDCWIAGQETFSIDITENTGNDYFKAITSNFRYNENTNETTFNAKDFYIHKAKTVEIIQIDNMEDSYLEGKMLRFDRIDSYTFIPIWDYKFIKLEDNSYDITIKGNIEIAEKCSFMSGANMVIVDNNKFIDKNNIVNLNNNGGAISFWISVYNSKISNNYIEGALVGISIGKWKVDEDDNDIARRGCDNNIIIGNRLVNCINNISNLENSETYYGSHNNIFIGNIFYNGKFSDRSLIDGENSKINYVIL